MAPIRSRARMSVGMLMVCMLERGGSARTDGVLGVAQGSRRVVSAARPRILPSYFWDGY